MSYKAQVLCHVPCNSTQSGLYEEEDTCHTRHKSCAMCLVTPHKVVRGLYLHTKWFVVCTRHKSCACYRADC